MFNLINVVMLTLVAVSFGAEAANRVEMQVRARTYSQTGCVYFTGNNGDIDVYYSEDNVYEGRVILRYGFHENFHGADWRDQREVEMTYYAPHVWRAQLRDVRTADRGGFFLDKFQFVFEVQPKNGASRIENGGSANGYYEATLPKDECRAGEMVETPIRVISK